MSGKILEDALEVCQLAKKDPRKWTSGIFKIHLLGE